MLELHLLGLSAVVTLLNQTFWLLPKQMQDMCLCGGKTLAATLQQLLAIKIALSRHLSAVLGMYAAPSTEVQGSI